LAEEYLEWNIEIKNQVVNLCLQLLLFRCVSILAILRKNIIQLYSSGIAEKKFMITQKRLKENYSFCFESSPSNQNTTSSKSAGINIFRAKGDLIFAIERLFKRVLESSISELRELVLEYR